MDVQEETLEQKKKRAVGKWHPVESAPPATWTPAQKSTRVVVHIADVVEILWQCAAGRAPCIACASERLVDGIYFVHGDNPQLSTVNQQMIFV